MAIRYQSRVQGISQQSSVFQRLWGHAEQRRERIEQRRVHSLTLSRSLSFSLSLTHTHSHPLTLSPSHPLTLSLSHPRSPTLSLQMRRWRVHCRSTARRESRATSRATSTQRAGGGPPHSSPHLADPPPSAPARCSRGCMQRRAPWRLDARRRETAIAAPRSARSLRVTGVPRA